MWYLLDIIFTKQINYYCVANHNVPRKFPNIKKEGEIISQIGSNL